MNGWGRILFWAILGVSLLANAVVLGLVLRLGNLRDLASGGSDGWAGLPSETRSVFLSELRANRPDLRALVADLGRARADMFAAAAARPYDRAAVGATQARVRSASSALQIATQLMMLKAFDDTAAKAP